MTTTRDTSIFPSQLRHSPGNRLVAEAFGVSRGRWFEESGTRLPDE